MQRIERGRFIQCIREDDMESGLNAARAAIRGGMRSIEVTLTTPGAYDVLRQLHEEFSLNQGIDLDLGAGSVMTVDQVDELSTMGFVRFMMSPVTDAAVIERARSNGLLPIPGALTPTEIWRAWQIGAPVVKVFPISAVGGIQFIQAVGGPFKDVKLLPTSSIAFDQVHDYLRMPNVLAVGVSRQIVDRRLVREAAWDEIRERAREWTLL